MSVLPPIPPAITDRPLVRWLNELRQRFGFFSVNPDQTPTGANQANAAELTQDVTEVTTVTASLNAYRLPKGQQGVSRTVCNGGNLDLYVYPATGERIDALVPNSAFTIPSGKTAVFLATRQGQWRSMLGA